MASKIAIRLAKKTEHDCDMSCNPETFERTYAGRHRKAMESIVWRMQLNDGIHWVGNIEPASEIIKQKYYLNIYNEGYIYGEPY